LDIVLVTVVPWGVAGVAAATSIAQLLSMALVLAIFFRGRQSGLHLRPAACIPLRGMTGQVLRIGIPTAVQSTSYNFTNLLLQAGINSFGTATVAAWTAYSKVDVLYWLTLNAMSAAVVTFVGQNYGARQIQRMERGIRTALWMTVAMTVAASALLILFREGLFRIFTDDPQVVAIGCDMLRYLTLFYLLFTVMEIYSGAVRATGDAFWPMILNLISVCVVRVAWVLLVLPRFHTVIVLCTSYPVSWGLGSILFWLYYRSRRWDKHQLTTEISAKEAEE
jgi:Na+-driven multidrug efflux pump